MTRLAAGAPCALLTVTSPAASRASAGAARAECNPAGNTTLVAGRRGRLYSVPTRGPRAERSPESLTVIGCLHGPWPPLELGSTAYGNGGFQNPAKGRINPEAVALAAYPTSFQGIDFNRNRWSSATSGTGP